VNRLETEGIIELAYKRKSVVPAFNIPYLPMMAPVVQALRDTGTFGLIMVARLELFKFEAQSLEAIRNGYESVKDELYTRLHLDHVPVIDEDGKRVDYAALIREAIDLGYGSVMIDGSRLGLSENIRATREIVNMGHEAGIPIEAELGAVMGHEAGPMPPYEELFASGKGFTDPDEAERFVKETDVDWLSVAIGNIHGAVAPAKKDMKKIEARLNIAHLDRIRNQVDIPIVLHGGTGIEKSCIMEAIQHGIAKINIATAIRQPYETALKESVENAQQAVYRTVKELICKELEITGSISFLSQDATKNF